MTVAELIQELQKQPQDIPVMVRHSEKGFSNVVKLSLLTIESPANWAHTMDEDNIDDEDVVWDPTFTALLLLP